MRRQYQKFFLSGLIFISTGVYAEDKIQLDTTVIKGNTELPQIIYIVPWRDMKQEKRKEQTLVLHSLYGDLFDPVAASTINHPIK